LVLISLATQRPFSISDQPFPDAHEYIDAAHRLADGLGYTTTVRDFPSSPHLAQAVNPPRFPPGTSLVLAPFALVGSFPDNVELGSRLIVVALVLAVAWAGYSLAGIWAALSALLAVVLLPLMRIRARWSVYLCGVIAGYSVVVREGGIVVVICLLLVLSGWDRLKAGLAACVPIAGLALYNWSTFGAPWQSGQGYWLGTLKIYTPSFILKHPWLHDLTGYNGELRLFHLVEHTAHGPIGPLPNLVFYPLVALGFATVFAPPFVSLLGLVASAWWWRQKTAQFALLLTALTVLFYLPNLNQTPRYLAAPCIILVIWASVGATRLGQACLDRATHSRNRDLTGGAAKTKTTQGDMPVPLDTVP
jgi:hypothetical protein